MKFDKTIVILGPTGSGKTGVAIKLAQELGGSSSGRTAALKTVVRSHRTLSTAPLRFSSLPCTPFQITSPQKNEKLRGAEIISADSRAIYREMDIGTAKPSSEEQQGIRHWGFDLVEPGKRFTVADWKEYAEEKIAEIRGRGKIPIVVGGTGLYIDALVYDYQFGENKKIVQDDRQKTAAEICAKYLIVGIKWESEELRQRLAERTEQMFTQELYEETKRLAAMYNWNTQAMKSNIYQFVWSYLQGEISLERAKELNTYEDYHLAKRQMTWFKRNKNINWLPLADVEGFVLKCIQDEQRR